MIGLYRPGSTPLHRLGAGLKLLALLVGTTALVLVRSPLAVAVGALVVAGAGVVAVLPPTVVWQQLRPLRWFVVALVPLQLWAGGLQLWAVTPGYWPRTRHWLPNAKGQ